MTGVQTCALPIYKTVKNYKQKLKIKHPELSDYKIKKFDVDTHIFSDVLVASDRAAISSDFRVAQDKIHQEKRENGEDKARRRFPERTERRIERLLFSACDEVRRTLENQQVSRIEKDTWYDADCFSACLSPDRIRQTTDRKSVV